MQRRTLLATAGAGIAAGLAGCLSTAQEPESNPNTDATDGSGATLGVSGHSEVTRAPDVAELSVAAVVEGDDTAAVRDELAERSASIRESLLAAGIDDDDVTTATYRIREDRDRRPPREAPEEREERRDDRRLRGVHEYAVTVRDVDAVGEVIDAALDAGAEDVGRIRFTLSEAARDEAREEALRLAVADAREEAEVVVDAKGLEIVGVESVSTDRVRVGPVRADYREVAEDDAGTVIDEGDVTVGASVEVVYRIA